MIGSQDISKLTAFLPLFSDPTFQAITGYEGGTKTEDGIMTFPYPIYNPQVLKFFGLAGQEIWSDFEYIPQEASSMVNNTQFISQANLEQIKTMLTYCVRGERFSDGHWGYLINTGIIQAILKRLTELKESV